MKITLNVINMGQKQLKEMQIDVRMDKKLERNYNFKCNLTF